MTTKNIIHLEDLPKASEQLIQYAGVRKKWCFYGDLGAGKTTFIKAICHYLGVQDAVTSPTYSLVNEYAFQSTNSDKEQVLYHLDLYRLNRIEEALDIGIEDYLYDDNYCFIEWAEIIEAILPEDVVKIYLKMGENGARVIRYE